MMRNFLLLWKAMDFNKPLSGLQTYLLNITFYLGHLFRKRQELVFAPVLKNNIAESSEGRGREWVCGWQVVDTTVCWPCRFLGKQGDFLRLLNLCSSITFSMSTFISFLFMFKYSVSFVIKHPSFCTPHPVPLFLFLMFL